ncbi:MAG: PAS domain S-box protein [Solirubrobacteraceae bacterium]
MKGLGVLRLRPRSFGLAAERLVARERDLREAVALHETVVATAHNAHVGMDEHGVVTAWNPAAERMFGWSAGEALGRQLAELMVPERHRAAHLEGLSRYLASGQPRVLGRRLELSALRRDGEEFPVEMTIARVDVKGRPHFYAFIADVSDRRAAEAERRLLATVVESTSDAVITIDGDMTITSFNAGAERVYGHRAADVVGDSVLELNPPGPGREIARGLVTRLLAGEELREHSVPCPRKDGTQIYLDLSSSPLRDEFGKVVGAANILRDVTEQRLLELGLAESEQRFRRIFEAAPIGVGLVSPEGSWLRVNRALCEIVGYSEQELLELSFQEITHPDDLEADLEYVREMLAGEIRTYQMDKRYLHKDGQVVWIKLSASLVRDEQGEPLHFVAQIQDIGAQKRADRARERALAQFNEAQRIARVGSWTWDPQADEASWSDEMYRLFGRASELGPATSEAFFTYVHPEDRDRIAQGYTQVFGGGPAFELDYRIQVGDGAERVLHAVGRADPGRTGCYLGTVQDVTELRQAERATAAAERQIRSMFEHAPIGKALLTVDGRIEQANPAFGSICARTRGDLEGVPLRELVHPADVAKATDAIRALVAGDLARLELELRLRPTAGPAVEIAVHGTLLRDEAGAPLHVLCQFQDISDRKRFEEQLQFMADHDPLTGLLNRRRFEAELDRHVAQVKRYGPTGGLIVLDIDNFKQVNDTLGHNAGDELIVSISAVLRGRLRESDVLARFGGDEFAVLLAHIDEADAKQVAQTLVEAVRTSTTLLDGERSKVTTSIGLAMFDSDPEALSGESILIDADLAMYDAKEAGGDRYATYSISESGASRTKARLTWVKRIEQALADDRFMLLAQPILDLHTGSVRQHELLLRMLDERDELIPPAAFLDIAERFGLIRRIDEWVSTRAIELIEHHPALQLEVNLSGRSLGDQQLLEAIERRLTDSAIDPSRLIFEVTETAAVANLAHAQAFAQRLRDLGCRFALDDFGAGFGSFYYLKHLPFDYIKIDGEFVQHAASSRIDQLLIEAVVRIAQGLGKETIAEFVTDERTQRMAKRLGVDYAQGFHIGQPLPVAQMIEGLAGDSIAAERPL